MAIENKDPYRDIAGNYTQMQKNSVINIYYERTGTLALLPKLPGKAVLDVGCGPGWYVEYLLEQGASVTTFDVNAEFVALTQARVGERATVLQADLAQPLAFAGDATFDLVVAPLVMHYVHEWEPVFREFHRVLRPEGRLVFSTHHPFIDWQWFQTENYFAVELMEDEWEGVGKVNFFRRPLTTISRDLEAADFLIERVLEPFPAPEMEAFDPERYARLHKNPLFLFFRARKAL